jgi:hypothetical protein
MNAETEIGFALFFSILRRSFGFLEVQFFTPLGDCMKFSTTFKSGMIAAGVAASALMGAQSALAVSVKVDQFIEAKDPWGMAAMNSANQEILCQVGAGLTNKGASLLSIHFKPLRMVDQCVQTSALDAES